MKKYCLIFVIAILIMHTTSIDTYAVLKLYEVRKFYPEYDDMGDAELTTRLHDAKYPKEPIEQFARKFGSSGFLEENVYRELDVYFDKYKNITFGYSVMVPSGSKVYDRVADDPHKNKITSKPYGLKIFIYVEKITPYDREMLRFLKNGHFDTSAIKKKVIQDDDKYISPIVKERFVSNHVAYSLTSCYEYRHADKSFYTVMHAITTFSKNKTYSIVIVTKPLSSIAEAQDEGERLLPVIKVILDSFMIYAN